jgi:hypothetical protein
VVIVPSLPNQIIGKPNSPGVYAPTHIPWVSVLNRFEEHPEGGDWGWRVDIDRSGDPGEKPEPNEDADQDQAGQNALKRVF